MSVQPPQSAPPTGAAACPTPPPSSDPSPPATPLDHGAASLPHDGPAPLALPALDLSTERLEAQDSLQWGGRPLAELTDAELADAVRGLYAQAPADRPVMRNQRNWLKLRVQWPQRRVHVHLRLDEIVLDWFRRDGAGFQARMNAVLRAYVDAQIEAEQRAR